VVVNQFGLSDVNGETSIYTDPERDWLSSTVEGTEIINRGVSHRISGRTVTGDAYLAKHAIDRIDFLKIDVEGAEYRVLNGFARGLADRRITVIQLEYGHINIFSHFLLLDFYRLLEPLGFALGKLYPDGVAFKPWVRWPKIFTDRITLRFFPNVMTSSMQFEASASSSSGSR
jgi:hypothetical protein